VADRQRYDFGPFVEWLLFITSTGWTTHIFKKNILCGGGCSTTFPATPADPVPAHGLPQPLKDEAKFESNL